MKFKKLSPTGSDLGQRALHLAGNVAPTGSESFIAFETKKEIVIFCTPIIFPGSVRVWARRGGEGGRRRGGPPFFGDEKEWGEPRVRRKQESWKGTEKGGKHNQRGEGKRNQGERGRGTAGGREEEGRRRGERG